MASSAAYWSASRFFVPRFAFRSRLLASGTLTLSNTGYAATLTMNCDKVHGNDIAIGTKVTLITAKSVTGTFPGTAALSGCTAVCGNVTVSGNNLVFTGVACERLVAQV